MQAPRINTAKTEIFECSFIMISFYVRTGSLVQNLFLLYEMLLFIHIFVMSVLGN